MKIENYLSILDTKRFGFNIAKVEDFMNCPTEILKLLKANDVKLVLSKVNLENLSLIKDIQVTYRYDIKNLENVVLNKNNDLIIRDAESKDIPALKEIAKESFLNYGHYANDPKLDIKKSNDIYSDWITRSCEDKKVADKIIIAEYKGEVSGFLSFKIYTKDNSKYAAGGIGAVSKKYRNLNIFRIITLEGLQWGKEIGLDWEEHNVLINNYPVNRSFIKLGFYTYKSFVTLHHWIE